MVGMTLAKTLRAWEVSATVSASACAPAPIPLSEPEVPLTASAWSDVQAWCVTPSDNALGLGDLLADASRAWGVNLPVVTIAVAPVPQWCLPVMLVPHLPTEDAPWVGLTSAIVDPWRPILIQISLEYWHACPLSRAHVVMHETGHAIGHSEHTVGGLMGGASDCNLPASRDVPDYHERSRAAARRLGKVSL